MAGAVDGVPTVEFEVGAQCSPHSRISGPTRFMVKFAYLSKAEGVNVTSFITTELGGGPENIDVLWTGFDIPSKGYVSSIFPGADVKGEFFCQQKEAVKRLQFSYYPSANLKIGLSRNGSPTTEEIDMIDSPKHRSVLDIYPASSETPTYEVGRGTNSPYWIQISLPIHAPPSLETTIQYGFLQ